MRVLQSHDNVTDNVNDKLDIIGTGFVRCASLVKFEPAYTLALAFSRRAHRQNATMVPRSLTMNFERSDIRAKQQRAAEAV